MRHAEKTDDPTDPNLSQAGARRATRLAAWVPNTFGKIDFIFATAKSKHSVRPIETVTPLSKKINVPIDSDYADQDYGALARHIMTKRRYRGAQTLICWHHGNIPPLMRSLGAADGTYPSPWPYKVFYLTLVTTFAIAKAKVHLVTEPF
jgi:hypothetical protein